MPISITHKNWRSHLVFWLFNYLYLYDYYLKEDNFLEAFWETMPEFWMYFIVAYFNYWVLLPRLLAKGLHWVYLLACLALIGACGLGVHFIGVASIIFDHEGWRNVYTLFVSTTWYILIATLYWYFEQLLEQRERQLRLENEKLSSEIKFLRSQISPHFLFNTLNNIYSLAFQKSDNTAPMVARLSTLMRYVLNESEADRVPLEKEIDTIRHYIELFLMGKPRSENIDFYVEGDVQDWKIAPLMLINFVENCFKHANFNQNEQAWAKILFSIAPDGRLTFIAENNLGNAQKAEQSKIGLQNVRRQLELNYPNQHQLDIKTTDDTFAVHLQINLQQLP